DVRTERWFREDQAVGDARTTESRLRDSRTESGREWPGNRLHGVSEKCIRHKPRERGENLTPRMKNSYAISNTQFVAVDAVLRSRSTTASLPGNREGTGRDA